MGRFSFERGMVHTQSLSTVLPPTEPSRADSAAIQRMGLQRFSAPTVAEVTANAVVARSKLLDGNPRPVNAGTHADMGPFTIFPHS
jgi:hypothetical protein